MPLVSGARGKLTLRAPQPCKEGHLNGTERPSCHAGFFLVDVLRRYLLGKKSTNSRLTLRSEWNGCTECFDKFDMIDNGEGAKRGGMLAEKGVQRGDSTPVS